MNKDSQHFLPSPAEQAAREIYEIIERNMFLSISYPPLEPIIGIIQQAIDRSVAEMEEKYRKLAVRLHGEAMKAVPDEYLLRGMHYKYLKQDVEAAGIDYAASELESLIPKQEGEK